MTDTYPRNRKEIVTINGVWDPCENTTEMSEMWTLAGLGWHGDYAHGIFWTQVSAPGGIGGYCHKLDGIIEEFIHMYGVQGISPFKNRSYTYNFSPLNSFYWKMKAEFRIRIEEDQTNSASGNLSHCLGFNLDGCVMHYGLTTPAGPGNTSARTSVNFNVTDSLIAITRAQEDPHYVAQIISSVAWAGSLDTWYDVKIEWHHNWYAEPNKVPVEIFVNNVSVLTYDVAYPTDWRADNQPDLSKHSFMGRCGPAIFVENDGGVELNTAVTGYFKDIHITQELRTVDWKYTDAIIQKGLASKAQLEITSSFRSQFGEGSDLKIYKKIRSSDNWSCLFRGIIRGVFPKARKHLLIEAEGYDSILFEEKTNNKSYTAKTAGYIVADAINEPDKAIFDVSTYFDATTTTYDREYMHTKKMSIITEMAALEGFLLFLDWRNNWHFQSYRTNPLSIHLIWGQSKIVDIEVDHTFVRRPNKIRVIGKGFTAEREIAVETFSSGSEVLRNFNRLDLTTQIEVDEALDFYISGLRTSIKMVTLTMRANYNLKKGHLIRVTSTDHGLQNHQFLISSIECNRINQMILQLLEVKPIMPALISDLAKRIDTKESDMYPSEYIAANDFFNIEGEATILINGIYEIEYSSAVVQTGKIVITDELMDDLVELWNSESPTQPTHLAYGTGTTEPLFNDTTLDTETARASATVARAVNIGNTAKPIYRTVEYEIDVGSPSNITELGLFNAASNGDMSCRVVFDSYSQAGTVTFRIKLTIIPAPGFAYLTVNGIKAMNNWFYDGTALTVTHIAHLGYSSFAAPNPYNVFFPSILDFEGAWWIPASATHGTFTKTKSYNRNMIKFVFDYPDYDVADEGGDTQWDYQKERFVGLTSSVGQPYDYFLACIFHRSQDSFMVFQGFSCKWILWLKFVAGEIEYAD